VCSLSDILETGDLPQRFFLSAKACAGILRRAEKRGKKSADTFAQCFEPRSPDGHARLIGDFSPTLNRMGGGQREPCVMYPGDLSGTLTARSVTSLGAPEVDGNQFIPMYMGNAEGGAQDKPFLTRQNLSAGISNQSPLISQSMAVRRLTPVECERLQGFPDNYTNIPWRRKEESPDGPRYKALGNSMAVPVMHWIGNRIEMLTSCTK